RGLQHAGDDVDAGAGRETHQDDDGLARPISLTLGLRRRGSRVEKERGKRAHKGLQHSGLLKERMIWLLCWGNGGRNAMGYMTEERRLIQETARAFAMKQVLPVPNKLEPEQGR